MSSLSPNRRMKKKKRDFLNLWWEWEPWILLKKKSNKKSLFLSPSYKLVKKSLLHLMPWLDQLIPLERALSCSWSVHTSIQMDLMLAYFLERCNSHWIAWSLHFCCSWRRNCSRLLWDWIWVRTWTLPWNDVGHHHLDLLLHYFSCLMALVDRRTYLGCSSSQKCISSVCLILSIWRHSCEQRWVHKILLQMQRCWYQALSLLHLWNVCQGASLKQEIILRHDHKNKHFLSWRSTKRFEFILLPSNRIDYSTS